MKDIIIWGIHTPAGSIAIISAIIALCSSKGGLRHRIAGKTYNVSMFVMLLFGLVAALINESPDDVFLAMIVSYSVFTAWLTVHHKNGETNFLEYIALAWVVGIGITAFFADQTWGEVRKLNSFSLWVYLAIFFTVGDVRNLLKNGLSGSQRIMRHIWRVGFSLLWTALAFADKIIKLQGASIEEMPYIVIVPTVLILGIILYWLYCVVCSSNKEFDNYS